MKLVLTAFSEELQLGNPTEPKRFLVFDANGETLRIPVGQETIQALAKIYYGASKVASVQPPAQEPDREEDFEDEPEELPEEQASEETPEEETPYDDSEDEVPNLVNLQRPLPRSESEVPSL